MSEKESEIIMIDPVQRGEFMPTSSDDRLLATLIYVTSFFTTIIGPLIIWLIKRDESTFIDYHGKEYLNFIISFTVYGFVAGISILLVIGILLIPAVAIGGIVLTIVAAVKAYQGEWYRIPLIFRLLK